MTKCERWQTYELAVNGPTTGNPFVDVEFAAIFKHNRDSIYVRGFYDGNGVYKVRYMPEQVGEWAVITQSNVAELNHIENTFECTPASQDNHGPVRVQG